MKRKRVDCSNWDLTPKEAVALQRELAAEVDVATPLDPDWDLVAATDISFNFKGDRVFAAVVVWSRGTGEVVERQGHVGTPDFPYVPGLLSFREIPHLLKCFEALEHTPDLVLVDGQGIAHPRRIGIGSHLGLCLGIPSVGCAKSVLCGAFDEPAARRGSRRPLVHKAERIGYALRTRTGVSPVFVSAGHLCRLEDAVDVVLATTSKYRSPDPIREAHDFANKLRIADNVARQGEGPEAHAP